MAALFRDIGTNINACSVLCHACIHLLAYMHACGAGVLPRTGPCGLYYSVPIWEISRVYTWTTRLYTFFNE
jgi:hypothetical protein